MNCPFYGKHATREFGLVDSNGNQCALILDAYAPCYMEALTSTPANAEACELLASAESRYAWERRVAAKRAKS